ncbi:MAG: hypothetical protein IPO81_06860 [Kouleothrix sp.]|nr:hypothetical protein [Kouleothrix sp.]
MLSRLRDKETRRQGDKETRRQGDRPKLLSPIPYPLAPGHAYHPFTIVLASWAALPV